MSMEKKKKGKPIAVSPEAHEIITRKAFGHKPRLKIREYVNVINNIPKEK